MNLLVEGETHAPAPSMATMTEKSPGAESSVDRSCGGAKGRPRNILRAFCYPLALLLPLTLLFRFTDLDITLSRLFFEPGAGWVHKHENPWVFIYNYGVIPAWMMAGAACGVFATSFWATSMRGYRKKALFFILLLIVGPGLVVNVIFKDHWGRPRPLEVEAFAGKQSFLSVWEPGVGGQGKSFPSGHSSMGFYLFAPFFLLPRTKNKQAIFFLGLGLGYGGLIGLTRMIQGGHFASDILWSAGFVYLCGLALYYLLGLDREPTPSANSGRSSSPGN
jgi:membrane-associated PAP2 superfamily phosphatase